MEIFGNRNVHLVKLNHPMDLINLPIIPSVRKFNQYLKIYNWLTFGSKVF